MIQGALKVLEAAAVQDRRLNNSTGGHAANQLDGHRGAVESCKGGVDHSDSGRIGVQLQHALEIAVLDENVFCASGPSVVADVHAGITAAVSDHDPSLVETVGIEAGRVADAVLDDGIHRTGVKNKPVSAVGRVAILNGYKARALDVHAVTVTRTDNRRIGNVHIVNKNVSADEGADSTRVEVAHLQVFVNNSLGDASNGNSIASNASRNQSIEAHAGDGDVFAHDRIHFCEHGGHVVVTAKRNIKQGLTG